MFALVRSLTILAGLVLAGVWLIATVPTWAPPALAHYIELGVGLSIMAGLTVGVGIACFAHNSWVNHLGATAIAAVTLGVIAGLASTPDSDYNNVMVAATLAVAAGAALAVIVGSIGGWLLPKQVKVRVCN